jgi:hypothetical protein
VTLPPPLLLLLLLGCCLLHSCAWCCTLRSFKLRSEALVLGAHKVPIAGIARAELPPLGAWF